MLDQAGATAGTGQGTYTIVYGKPYVSVSPTSGTPTAQFTIHGKYVWPGGCPSFRSAPQITFKFYWYKVISSKVALWTTAASTCSGGVVDAGTSPPLQPPSPLNYVSTFVIQVVALDSAGAGFGSIYGASYTDTTLYKVVAAPSPSPGASAPPPCGQPGAAPCPSPTPTSCAAPSAALPPASPGGKDAVVLFALAVIGALPIGGLAMVFSPGLWTRRSQWARLIALLGLSLLLLTAAGCTWNPNQKAEASPTQSEPSPSASPSTSC